jgi:hypothetical protein
MTTMQASFMCERVCEPPGPFDKDSTVAHYIHLRLNPHQKVRFNCSSLYSSTIESSSKDPESSLPLFDLRLCILVVAFSQIINQFLTPSREQHTLPLTTTTSMPPGLLHSSPQCRAMLIYADRCTIVASLAPSRTLAFPWYTSSTLAF